MPRHELIRELARRIAAIERPHPIRVAIDGVDAAGKTTLADELVAPLRAFGRPVIRASIDGFHHPRAIRYARGESGDAYFRDSFDRRALIDVLLRPLGPGGDRRHRRAIFDYRTDAPVEGPVEEAPPDAVLLFDGVFLLVEDLRPHWDFSIFVHASFETTTARAEVRDRKLFGTAAQVRQRYEQRYVPGQRLYLAAAQPERHASLVVDNNATLEHLPFIERTEQPEDLRAYVEHYVSLLLTAEAENAWHALVEVGPAALAHLVDCFDRATAHYVKVVLVRVASEYRSLEALPFLSAALRDRNAEIWKAALDGLVSLAAEEAMEAVRAARATAGPEQQSWIDEALKLNLSESTFHRLQFGVEGKADAFVKALQRFLDSPRGQSYADGVEVWATSALDAGPREVYLNHRALTAALAAFSPGPSGDVVRAEDLPAESVCVLAGTELLP